MNFERMKIMKSNKKTERKELTELEALDASIKHWVNDIEKRFKHGDSVIHSTGLPRWESDDTYIDCDSETCALCQKYRCHENNQKEKCPLERAGLSCNQTFSPWKAFIIHPSLKSAQNMIKALKSLREIAKKASEEAA